MRTSPRLLSLAAASLCLVACAPAAPAPAPVPTRTAEAAATPDPDEIEAAVQDLHARYVVVMNDLARGAFDVAAVESVMAGEAIDSAEAYRDHVVERGGTFDGSFTISGLRIESVDLGGGVAVVLVACEDWSGVVITPEGEAPYTPLAPSHSTVARLTMDGNSLTDLRITSENAAEAGTEC